MGQWWPVAGLGALSSMHGGSSMHVAVHAWDLLKEVSSMHVAVHVWDLLKEVPITFITSTIVWFQVNSREGTQLYPSTENWVEDLLSVAPPNRTGPSFPISESLPSESFHKPLVLLHQRAGRLKTTITEN